MCHRLTSAVHSGEAKWDRFRFILGILYDSLCSCLVLLGGVGCIRSLDGDYSMVMHSSG